MNGFIKSPKHLLIIPITANKAARKNETIKAIAVLKTVFRKDIQKLEETKHSHKLFIVSVKDGIIYSFLTA